MLKIAVLDKKRNEVGESMEEGNLLLNRMMFFFVKKKRETCMECGVIFFQMPKREREPHSYSDEDSSR